MSSQHSLVEFLEQAGNRVYVYDIGRRIGALSRDEFLAFEHARAPYPRPWQRQAWIGLVQADLAGNEPVIWFLRLHLDEQGLLVQAERDYLLDRLMAAAQTGPVAGTGEDFLRDNPLAFTPRDDRMALFHALLGNELGRAPSRYFAHARDYFSGRPGWDQWGFVGYQGIADVACRGSSDLLAAAIPHLPEEPLVALCHCLESRIPDQPLLEALTHRLEDAVSTGSPEISEISALIRGLSAGATDPVAMDALASVLSNADVGQSAEVLATIAGRAWEALGDEALLGAFLSRLVANDAGQPGFAGCISDLLSVPSVAPILRSRLRDPDGDPAVRMAFGKMLQTAAKT